MLLTYAHADRRLGYYLGHEVNGWAQKLWRPMVDLTNAPAPACQGRPPAPTATWPCRDATVRGLSSRLDQVAAVPCWTAAFRVIEEWLDSTVFA
ncbi:MAG: hypothetical protein JW940_20860 [Polyangiaceae bacterium]|nr:hypothetical protein [Polyangiaceae bacterium]